MAYFLLLLGYGSVIWTNQVGKALPERLLAVKSVEELNIVGIPLPVITTYLLFELSPFGRCSGSDNI